MKVVFRVDASDIIGTGHVMRCLTLADKLKTKKVECYFISRPHTGNLINLIKGRGYKVFDLPSISQKYARHNSGSDPIHSYWLGCDWQEDCKQTKKILQLMAVNWLIVDHYAIDFKWEKEQRQYCQNIMIIDDLADRRHDADILLDQNLNANLKTRYDEKVSASCRKLLGLDFALLHPSYSAARSNVVVSTRPVKRIFMYFGHDNNHLISRLVSIFLSFNRNDIQLDIVLARNAKNRDNISKLIELSSNMTLYDHQETLAPMMLKADLAIGAGGATTWERICLGLPALVITVADNQRECSQYLHKLGLINLIGNSDEITDKKLSDEIYKVLKKKNLKSWSDKCLPFCSGNGAEKVANTILKK